MAVSISVTGEKNLNKLIDDLGDLEIDPHEIVERFKPVARAKAPVANDGKGGGTRDAIGTVKPKPSQGILRLYQPKKRNREYGISLRPYHLFMHNEGEHHIAKYIKHGKGNFMNEVGKLIAQDIDNQIKQKTSKL